MYASRVLAAVDTSERDAALQQLELERKEKERALAEEAKAKQRAQQCATRTDPTTPRICAAFIRALFGRSCTTLHFKVFTEAKLPAVLAGVRRISLQGRAGAEGPQGVA